MLDLTTIRKKLSGFTPSAIARASELPRSTVVDALKVGGNPTMRTLTALSGAVQALAPQDEIKTKSRKPSSVTSKAQAS